MVVGNHPTERIQKEQGNPGSRPLPPFCFNGKLPFGWWWTPTQIMVKLGSSNGEDSTKMGGSKHFQGVGIPWIDLIPSSLQCKGHWSYLWQVLVVSWSVIHSELLCSSQSESHSSCCPEPTRTTAKEQQCTSSSGQGPHRLGSFGWPTNNWPMVPLGYHYFGEADNPAHIEIVDS